MGSFNKETTQSSGEIIEILSSFFIVFFLLYNKKAIFNKKKGGKKLNEIEKLLDLEEYKVIKIEERKENAKMEK